MPDLRIAVQRVALWEDDSPEIFEAVVGRSKYTLKRWSVNEGLTMHTRGKGTGARDYWLVDEVTAFLRHSGRTNHETRSAADRSE